MPESPAQARPCDCVQPVRDRETCLLCGRSVPPPPEHGPRAGRTTPGNPWTHSGVVRALRTFTFFRGRQPTPADWSPRTPPDWPPLPVVEHLFGSLPDALTAARGGGPVGAS